MTYVVRLREEAEYDVEEAAYWYGLQQPGLGYEFLDTLIETLNAIERNPLAYPLVHRDTHRAILQKFPFAVFYRVQNMEISVVSVMHGSRNPARWQRRV